MKFEYQNQEGYIAILTIIIVMAVVLAISATVTFSSIGEAQSALSLYKGEDTLSFVESCAEDALWKFRENSTYNAGQFTIPSGTCNINIISQNGSRLTIDATTQTTQYKKTIEIVFDHLQNGISIVSWKEKEL